MTEHAEDWMIPSNLAETGIKPDDKMYRDNLSYFEPGELAQLTDSEMIELNTAMGILEATMVRLHWATSRKVQDLEMLLVSPEALGNAVTGCWENSRDIWVDDANDRELGGDNV